MSAVGVRNLKRELPRNILAETAYTIQSYTIYRLYTRPSNLAAHRSLCSYNLKNYPDALNSTSLQPQTVGVNVQKASRL